MVALVVVEVLAWTGGHGCSLPWPSLQYVLHGLLFRVICVATVLLSESSVLFYLRSSIAAVLVIIIAVILISIATNVA